ncbi:hypothetical protein C1H46_035474 [Malus baccata]|uniref:SKI-interacting protein SKIP SNW domain-containing protein n=1 Tax=Malus baccata TaxID=106549 RepID=A0A540KXR5_MALBA|nr:hypothetical protein C1H46_035474 [Malus baccata]
MAALKQSSASGGDRAATFYDHPNDPWGKQRYGGSAVAAERPAAAVVKHNPIPQYPKRKGFVPRKVEDFGDGGAFPEVHIAQYPLGMGRNMSKSGTSILPVSVHADGKIAYDALVKQNENSKKIVYSQYKDLVPKILKNEDEVMVEKDEDEELQKEVEETAAETRAALEKIVNAKLGAAQPNNVAKQSTDSKLIKYRELARKARFERIGGVSVSIDPSGKGGMETDMPKETREEREGRLERNKIRKEMHVERERKRRLEAKDGATGKKSRVTTDRDRDVSEKVALGMANVGGAGGGGGEVMYDHRLFNQEKGMDSGFATDDQYNIYDKGLFAAQPMLSTLYRPKKDVDSEMYGGADAQLDKIMKTDRFKPDKGFEGTAERASERRDGPVESEADIFGLDRLMTKMKNKGEKPTDKDLVRSTTGVMAMWCFGYNHARELFAEMRILKLSDGARTRDTGPCHESSSR